MERIGESWFGGLWQAGGFGSGRLVALHDAPCHVFSGEAKAEAGWGSTSSPPPYTLQAIRANTRG